MTRVLNCLLGSSGWLLFGMRVFLARARALLPLLLELIARIT